MSIEYVELVDYLAIAVEVTGLSVETITRVAKQDLADSALHAPAAGFGATEFAVLAIAAGESDEAQTAIWLGQHLAPPIDYDRGFAKQCSCPCACGARHPRHASMLRVWRSIAFDLIRRGSRRSSR